METKVTSGTRVADTPSTAGHNVTIVVYIMRRGIVDLPKDLSTSPPQDHLGLPAHKVLGVEGQLLGIEHRAMMGEDSPWVILKRRAIVKIIM